MHREIFVVFHDHILFTLPSCLRIFERGFMLSVAQSHTVLFVNCVSVHSLIIAISTVQNHSIAACGSRVMARLGLRRLLLCQEVAYGCWLCWELAKILYWAAGVCTPTVPSVAVGRHDAWVFLWCLGSVQREIMPRELADDDTEVCYSYYPISEVLCSKM
jgi:hypothetical protein